MKDYILKDAKPSSPSKDLFLTGLVFGFDVGTGSIGYAVRKGSKFKDVGVLICPEDINKLDKRRGSRSQRRRLRNRSRVRDWLAESVAKFALPHVANTKEALLANGFPKSGLQAKWHLLIPALGFQFPKAVVVADQAADEEDDEDQDEA